MLLTQEEVAQRLRCSPTTVKRLRSEGKLAYLPGRPVKIDERELERYIEETTCRRPSLQKPSPDTTRPAGQTAVEAAARAWALKTVLLQKQRLRNGSS